MPVQPAPAAIRVLVADNSVINTELLAQAIQKDRHIRVVDVCTSRAEVLQAALRSKPDILLISESLGNRQGGGLEVISELRIGRPDLKPIVLLDCSTPQNVTQAFRAGAKGVFSRNQPVKALCKCIAMVSERQIWATSAELNFLLEALAKVPYLRAPETEAITLLSERERDVVRCLAEGLSNREIGSRLTISQHTVKNYMFRIFEKLGVSSRLELLFFVLSRTGHAQDVVNQLSRRAPTADNAVERTKVTSIRQPDTRSSNAPAAAIAGGLGSA